MRQQIVHMPSYCAKLPVALGTRGVLTRRAVESTIVIISFAAW